MTEAGRHDCETLLAHTGWVRALARHLTADTHTADDLAQEALAAALVRPPPADRPLRGWLAGVLRNLAREDRRNAGRRRAHERELARGDADLTSAHLLERLDSHRFVVEAVVRLDEPYRTAILLRYFEDLSPGAIAARTATPLRTVHTRLNRGLAHLRSEFDRTHGGDRQTWLIALIPFARGPFAGGSGAWSAAAIGAFLMDAKMKIGIVAFVVVGLCSTLALWPNETGDVGPVPLAAARGAIGLEAQDADGPRPRLEDARAVVDERAQDGAPRIAASGPGAVEAGTKKLTGRVIDLERAPVAGVEVRFVDPARGAHDGLAGRTGADGAFELENLGRGGTIDIASAGWTSVLRPDVTAASFARDHVLVVAPSVTLAGVVLDEARRPLVGAAVAVQLPFGLRSRFDAILDGSSTVERSAKTDAAGRFELSAAPLVPGAKLKTTHETHLRDERDLPQHHELGLEIVLRSAQHEPQRLVGKVVDPEGSPVEGAWVALGRASTKSGPSGAFTLDLAASADEAATVGGTDTTLLRAVKRGFLPGEVVHPIGRSWPDPLVLRLGGPALVIEGRIVDAHGEPVANAQVWTDEETHFGSIEIEAGEMSMRAGASIEGILRGDPWTRRTRADANGRFAFTGLLPRDYRLHALDTQHLLVTTVSFAAGVRNAEIRMPQEVLHERVAGRVTSLAGEAVEGVEVVLERETFGVQGSEIDRLQSSAVTTDAQGRFAFQRVSRAVNQASVRGVDVGLLGFRHRIGPGVDVEALEIAVPMRVHVQIEAVEPSEFDEVAILDASGEKLYLSIHHGQSSYAIHEVRLQEGRTEPFAASEEGVILVLYKQDAEVRRLPLELVRGRLNTIRP